MDAATLAEPLDLAPETFWQTLAYYARIPLTWVYQLAHNTRGILAVWDLILLRPVPGGLVGRDHPWVTGINPATGLPIWPKNIVYRTARKWRWPGDPAYWPRSDEEIVNAVGRYLALMMECAASSPESPRGKGGRMPPGINYIHGPVQYHSGLILFNDFKEGIYHLSDPRFVAEMKRFGRETGREMLLVFRERIYDPRQYAYFSGMIRTVLPWMANPNGAPRNERNSLREPGAPPGDFLVNGQVLWGFPSPYPVLNPVNGNWIHDVYRLARAGGDASRLKALARPPIEPGRFFQGTYRGTRVTPRWPERLLAAATHRRLRLRGERGNHYFIDERKLKAPADPPGGRDESPAVKALLDRPRIGAPLPEGAREVRFLLVPGLGWSRAASDYFKPNLAWFNAQGLDARVVATDPFGSVRENAESVRAAVLASDKPVVLIGHSKGGVEAVEAARRFPEVRAKAPKVVAVQAPYYGTPWADWVLARGWATALLRRRLPYFGADGVFELTRARRSGLRQDSEPLAGVELFSLTSRVKSFGVRSFPEWLRVNLGILPRGATDGVVATEDSIIRGSRYAVLDGVGHWDLVASCCKRQRAEGFAVAATEAIVRWIFSRP